MAEYIELEVAVKAFNNFDAGRADSPPFTLLTPREFAEYLHELPTADVAPVVHGHKVDDGGFYARCSQCDGVLPLCANYCPNCGAKMDGGGDT